MLNTPFGDISIAVNGKNVKYELLKLDNIEVGNLGTPVFMVDGRYQLRVDIEGASLPVTLTCEFPEYISYDKINIEAGQSLALKSWYRHNIKISFGTEDEISGTNIEYVERGLKAVINSSKVKTVVFGVAWVVINDKEKEDIYTWFAADPTLQ